MRLIYYKILARRLLVGLRLTVLAPLREPVNSVLLACAICDLLTYPVLCSMSLLTVHMSSHACAGRVQENCAWHGHHSCFRQHVSYMVLGAVSVRKKYEILDLRAGFIVFPGLPLAL